MMPEPAPESPPMEHTLRRLPPLDGDVYRCSCGLYFYKNTWSTIHPHDAERL